MSKKKSFFYDSTFDYDLSHRTTNVTELNALEDYTPIVPTEYTETKYLFTWLIMILIKILKLLKSLSTPN